MQFRKAAAFFIILLTFFACKETPKYAYPFLDPSMDIDARVDDLVGRLTLEEKVGQMMNAAPAIDRLGIPAYNWWSEGLHGVARAGLATVFPQAIGMAASWDTALIYDIANVISDEARAKHHNFVRNDKRFIYQGLTLWSPNINIFRDPRWGRGQETYGEDPYLSGMLSVPFIKGLQGNDSTYYKTIATVKHFAVHSGPEPERHVFDAIASEKDMRETYYPQFEMGIKEGHAYSAMCAYNKLNGEACCGSDMLMNEVLREEWGFEGFIVSDCGAILDIYENHKLTKTAQEAAALAVKSGTDLNCGTYYRFLTQAIEEGLLTMDELDVSVKRLFKARFKLGMFDPDDQVSYAQIPYTVVDSKEHQELALKSARESMVLLKNQPHKGASTPLLPLNDQYKKIAVIGPNADQWLMLLGNYNGVPSKAITPLEGIRQKVGSKAEVNFAQGCELADGMPMFYIIGKEEFASPFKVDYYNNDSLGGEVLYSEEMDIIDANWKDKAPREDMDDDAFSVRWTGTLKPSETADYQLGFISTCNTKMFLDGKEIARTVYHFRDELGDPRLKKSETIRLEAGKEYALMLEAKETFADAQVQLVWAKPQPNLQKEALELAKSSDLVIMCMGLTPRMEGEEMDVVIDGFRGGDRTSIDLPKTQRDLIKAIHATGKPVVLVLLNGSALAINWEDRNIPAILEAWYPGQASGTALADVLFGDYNPSGRLPVTFYSSVSDLPSFTDYEMTTQTYRYFKGKPLYPFGYGLSYTTFSYTEPVIESNNGNIIVKSKVKNTGSRDGDEVVQLYLSTPETGYKIPVKSLKGFTKINLKSGDEKEVAFTLTQEDLMTINMEGKKVFIPGVYTLSVGGGQNGMLAAVDLK